jgi:hypothetical protein
MLDERKAYNNCRTIYKVFSLFIGNRNLLVVKPRFNRTGSGGQSLMISFINPFLA